MLRYVSLLTILIIVIDKTLRSPLCHLYYNFSRLRQEYLNLECTMFTRRYVHFYKHRNSKRVISFLLSLQLQTLIF